MTKIKLTENDIKNGESKNGGYSKQQLELVGVKWPPRKGCKKEIIGKTFDGEVINQFISLKDQHLV